MDVFEELVLRYLTMGRPHVFVSPQYDIGKGWSCPDFLALDFGRKLVSIVEVSAGGDPKELEKKVEAREHQWFSPLRIQLQQTGMVNSKWGYQVEVFVRGDAYDRFQNRFRGQADVVVHKLEEEDVAFPWKWKWPRDQS